MMQTKNVHNCKNELNEVNLRATPARLQLMHLLESSAEPLDVQTMIEHLKEKGIRTDPATVFRIINMFTEKGLVKLIQLNEGKFRYELASKADHHHLVCTKCGQIQDMSDCNIDVLEHHIEKKKNFIVTSHALEFYGICANCQQ